MPRSLPSRRVARKGVELAQVRPRRSVARRALVTAGRRGRSSYRLIGLPLAATIFNINNIRWHYSTRTDEQLAVQLGKSLLRLGICNARDWSGSALDLVERGFKRFCRVNGADDAKKIWDGELRITDCQFDSDGSQRGPFDPESQPEPKLIYLIGEFNSAASIPIGPTLALLLREHDLLPKAFFEVLTENLYKWMRVYDFRDAVEQANCYMEGADEEDLKDSFYPLVEKKIPGCLQVPTNIAPEKARRFLADIQPRLKNPVARQLIRRVREPGRPIFQARGVRGPSQCRASSTAGRCCTGSARARGSGKIGSLEVRWQRRCTFAQRRFGGGLRLDG